jgi:Papain family cysteine protease
VSDVTASFTYNPASQIATYSRSNDGYAWGGHYNINRTYGANGLNQLTTAGATARSYDGRGNLTQSGAQYYAYTSENRLVTASQSAAGGSNAALIYDPVGRLQITYSYNFGRSARRRVIVAIRSFVEENMTDIPTEGDLGRLSVLKDYGYTTGEEVYFLAQAIGPELSQLIGLPPGELMAQLAPALRLPAQADMDAVQALTLPMGVPVSGRPLQPLVISAVANVASTSVNLVPQFPPIRLQGERGTCVAHATVAVLEHRLAQSGAPIELSEQFLYWDCKQNDGQPSGEGTWVKVAFDMIFRDGICPEENWPYQLQGCSTEGCGPPPLGAIPAALTFRHATKALTPTSVQDIKTELAQGSGVTFSVPVFRSWYHSTLVRLTGKINMPVPNDIVDGGHAMTFVGFEDSTDPGIGGGRFIIRNSWGEAWAPQSAYGAGYGSIPYEYIARYCWEAYGLN